VPETRTPAEIETDIIGRRQDLAVLLDEIAVRVHPKTIMDDAKAKAAATLDRTAGRAYVAVNRAVSDVKAQFVDEEGAPRMERVVPVALAVVALGGGLVLLTARRRRR
jgi:uncharacterized protein DUF3618